MELENKVVVVTGGASGIGRSLCERFALEGASAVVVADIDSDGIKSTLSNMKASTKGLGVQCDVSNEDDVNNLVSEALGKV